MRYRKYIIRNPNWYIANFVILAEQSSSKDINSITCRPFCEQIFGGKKEIYSFLFMNDNDATPHIQCARNFWKLFIANEYEPIEFHNQGNVQAKIDNDLVEEIQQLKELEAIKKEVAELYSQIESHKIVTKKALHKIIDLENKRQEVQLFIRLNGKINKKIEECKQILKEGNDQ